MRVKKKEKKEYPSLGKDDVCRLMELSYEMGKKGEKYSLWELYLHHINQNKDESKEEIDLGEMINVWIKHHGSLDLDTDEQTIIDFYNKNKDE